MVSTSVLVSLVPLFPLLGFILIALTVKKITHNFASFVACASIFASFAVSVFLFISLNGITSGPQQIEVTAFEWIKVGDFSANMGFLVDPLSIIFMMIITGVGFLIHVYSIGYMHHDEGVNRFFSYLNLFVFFMLLLVMGSNYLVMFIGWEGVGLCSYLLIGFWFKNQSYNDAANKAFIMNRIGDLGLLLGVFAIIATFGSLQYTDVLAQAANNSAQLDRNVVTCITILLFIGAMGKSAQVPLYTWLPDAMAGPTPVSALIHAATMVTAGIYMIARNNVLYTLSPFTLELVGVVGAITALLGATIALTQNDIKKVLAYSTVSQLGLMFVALGVGAFSTGIFHMATHAFFKALLFLGAGSVIHALSGEQDLRKMGGLKKYLPITYITFFIGVLAISGIPPFSGFFSKDEILAQAFAEHEVLYAVSFITSLLTAFYMFRLFFLTFWSEGRMSDHVRSHIHESPATITFPLIVLAILATIGGFIGMPEIFHAPHFLSEFLAPVFAPSNAIRGEHHHLDHTTEIMLMAVIVVLSIVMILIAYSMYVSKKQVPVEDGQIGSSVQRTLYNKYYVDEIYDFLVVKPLYWLSSTFDKVIEQLGIDRIVNAFGGSVIVGSKASRLLQQGSIGYYVFVMVIGVVLILVMNILKSN
jgi:NADH-quinone oxidoreductase subunit L